MCKWLPHIQRPLRQPRRADEVVRDLLQRHRAAARLEVAEREVAVDVAARQCLDRVQPCEVVVVDGQGQQGRGSVPRWHDDRRLLDQSARGVHCRVHDRVALHSGDVSGEARGDRATELGEQ